MAITYTLPITEEIDNLKSERWQGNKSSEEIDKIDSQIEILEKCKNIRFTLCFYPTNERWDNIEVHPVRNIGEDAAEQCEEYEADYFSVYLHLVAGGLICIADLPTRELAEGLKELLVRFLIGGKQR